MVGNRLRIAVAHLLTVGFLAGPVVERPVLAATDAEIKASVERGVAYIRSQFGGFAGGQLGLATLALIKAGVPASEADVSAALTSLAGNVRNGAYVPANQHRYEAGVTLMALSAADPVKYKPQIEAIAKYLLDAQQNYGAWYYPEGMSDAGTSAAGDTSITQYALLGLWEATRAGVNVPKETFDKAANWHLATQVRDGFFVYHPNRNSVVVTGTHSMTTAGTASLLLCRLMLYPDAKEVPLEETEEETAAAGKTAKKKRGGIKYGILIPAPLDSKDEEIEAEKKVKGPSARESNFKPTTKLSSINNGAARGLKWLSSNFRVNLRENKQPFEQGQNWDSYYLYGLERLAALGGLTEIDGRDWYMEGCDYLISTQHARGLWNLDQGGPDADTCFAVMFMVKATAKTLKAPPARRRRDPRLGGGILVGARGLPDDLTQLQVGASGVKPRKLKGAVDELLGELEKIDSSQIEAVQEAIVDVVVTEDPEALVGQRKRLQTLSRDRRAEVRRTAVWALGRTNDLNAVPCLLERLADVDLTVIVEARNALRFMTRIPDFLELSETPTPEELSEVARQARQWYLTVRPYSERDDLLELVEAKP